MFSALRPFLFSLDPETAHDLAIKSLKLNPLPSKMFKVEDEEYGLYIPLDPFFVVGEIKDGKAMVLEGEEFDKIQPIIEAELEQRDF